MRCGVGGNAGNRPNEHAATFYAEEKPCWYALGIKEKKKPNALRRKSVRVTNRTGERERECKIAGICAQFSAFN